MEKPATLTRVDASVLPDVVVVLLCTMGMLVGLWWAFSPQQHTTHHSSAQKPEIGTLVSLNNLVRRRPEGTLVWHGLQVRQPVFESDAVYAAEDAHATIELHDGTVLHVEQNSLIVLHRSPTDIPDERNALAIKLVRGTVDSRNEQRSLSISAGAADIALASGTQARMSVDDAGSGILEVHRGQVSFQEGPQHRVAAGHAVALNVRTADASTPTPIIANLIAPAPDSHIAYQGQQPTLQFEWHSDEQTSILELSRTLAFTEIHHALSATGQALTLPSPIAPGVWYWRVRPEGAADNQYFEARRITVIEHPELQFFAPRPGSVVDLSRGTELFLSWNQAPQSEGYVLELSTDRRFTDIVYQANTHEPYRHVRTPLDEGEYCARVALAIPSNATHSWSTPTCFDVLTKPRLQPPKLYQPTREDVPSADEASGETGSLFWWLIGGVARAKAAAASAIVLRWEPIPGAHGYLLEISSDDRFENIILTERLQQPYFRWHHIARRTYYWRVRGMDSDGREGIPSQPQRIAAEIQPPKLLEPERDITTIYAKDPGALFLRWETNELMREYIVEVSDDQNFQSMVHVHRTENSSYRYLAPDSRIYYIRVRGVDLGGELTSPSTVRKWTVAPKAPTLLEPTSNQVIEGSDDVTVTYKWRGYASRSFELHVARDAQFKETVVRQQVSGSTITYPITEEGTFYWRVRGRDPTTAWSTVRQWELTLTRATADAKHDEASEEPRKDEAEPPPVIKEPSAAPPRRQHKRQHVEAQMFAGPTLGVVSNFGPVTSPQVGLEIGLQPWLARVPVALIIGAQCYGARRSVRDAPPNLELRGSLIACPLSFSALYRLRARLVRWTFALGAVATIAAMRIHSSRQPTTDQLGYNVGGVARVGAEKAVGQGTGFVDAGLALTGRTNHEIGTLSIATLDIRAGYRFWVW